MRSMDALIKMSVEELSIYSKSIPLQERLQLALDIANHLSDLVACMFPEAANRIAEGELCSDGKSKKVAESLMHRLVNTN